MLFPTSKLFVLAFAVLSISALFSDDLVLKRSKLTGAAQLLADPSVSPDTLNEVFISIIQSLSFEPVGATNYAEALELIISYSSLYEPEAMSSKDVDEEVEAIKKDLIKDLQNRADTFKERLQESVGKIITLMKRELVFMLVFMRNVENAGLIDRITVRDRVSELKESLQEPIANLREKNDIDKNRKRNILTKLNEAIPENSPDVQALKAAFEDNAKLFTVPKEVLETVRDVQLGQLEAEIVKRKGAAVNADALNILKKTLDLVCSFYDRYDNLRFIIALLDELTTITLNKANVFGPATTPEAVRGVQAFLADLIRYITQTKSTNDKKLLEDVMYKLNLYYLNSFRETFYPISFQLHDHNIFNIAGLFSDFSEDDKSPEGLKFQKYVNIVAAICLRHKMKHEDMKNIIAKLDEYTDISETEVSALDVLADYFFKSDPPSFIENALPAGTKRPYIFLRAFVGFLELISITNQETLSKKNVFSRFNDYLADKVDKATEPKDKWHYATLQVANFLQSRKDFDLVIPPLDESQESLFVDEQEHGFFKKTHKTILDLLSKATKKKIETLLKNKQNSSKWQPIIKQIETDRTEFRNKEELNDQENKRLLSCIAKVLTNGLTFAAEKQRLI